MLRSLPYNFYRTSRKAVRAVGLTRVLRRVFGPLIGRILFRLSPGGVGPTQLRGHTMYLARSGSYPPVDMAMGRYEPGTTQLFEELLKPGMVVIDVGAHVGYYTLIAAKQVGPGGKVYAFEPDRDNHALLEKNIELNGYNNVLAARSAVSDRVGASDLYLTALDSGRHSLFHQGLPERGSVAVETTTVDSFLESQGWPGVDLVKIDVEGAEFTVLDGMAQLLERSAGLKMIIEFNPALIQGAGVSPLQFLERLTSAGWQTFLIEEANGLVPLTPVEAPSLVNRLLAAGSSVNLFGTWR